MKKILLSATSLLLILSSANAQYFQHAYGSACEALGDGTPAAAGLPGHIIVGHSDVYSGMDIELVRTNPMGNSSSPPAFNQVYRLIGGSGTFFSDPVKVLSTSTNDILVVANTNTSASPNTEFAVMKFNGVGGPSWITGFTDLNWSNATATSACLGIMAPNQIYITGYVTTTSPLLVTLPFVVCIDWSTNTVLWSQVYDIRPGVADDNRPADLAATLSGSRLMIVGTSDNGGIVDGFRLEVDYANGSVIQRVNQAGVLYDVMFYDNSGGIDIITGICTRLNSSGQTFHVICGNSDFGTASAGMHPWLFQIDANGWVMWSKDILYSIASSTATVTEIVARINTSGQHEYYLTGSVNNGPNSSVSDPVVFKCDLNGNAVSEFNYPMPGTSTQVQRGKNLGIVTTPGSEGLAIYCTDGAGFVSGAAGDMYIIKSYFNGVNNCGEVLNLFSTTSIATTEYDDAIGLLNSLTMLPVSIIPLGADSDSPYCSSSFIPSGSNARTGANQETAISTGLGISPNPVATNVRNLQLQTNYAEETQLQISLFNIEGREVESFSRTVSAGEQQTMLGLSNSLAAGIYLVRIQTPGGVETLRLVVE